MVYRVQLKSVRLMYTKNLKVTCLGGECEALHVYKDLEKNKISLWSGDTVLALMATESTNFNKFCCLPSRYLKPPLGLPIDIYRKDQCILIQNYEKNMEY